MRFLTLAQCKKQLVVEHDEDDELIISKAAAAEEVVENYLNAPLESFARADGTLPYSIMEGIKLILGSLYAQREGFSSFDQKTTQALLALVKPYKSYAPSLTIKVEGDTLVLSGRANVQNNTLEVDDAGSW